MRSALFVFIIVLFLPFVALANEAGLVMPVTPWMEDEQAQQDIVPKKISLADLENMLSETTKSEKSHKKQTPSPLENLYSDRIIDELEQYGYDLFQTTSSNNQNTIPAGAIQSDYILSSGDRLDIVIRGQINKRRTYEINNKGLLIIENLRPIAAAGKSLGHVEETVKSEISTLHNTDAYVSLSSIRQIGVLVVGHVEKPGRKNLTAFHTALDALSAAGGIKKTGSLRRIKLVRKGKSYFIDLYQLLTANDNNGDKLLQDGDRLIIPPIGATIAISGSVKRPAIYEIRKGEKLNLHQALGLGGGALTPGQNRYIKLEYTTNGEETVQDIDTPKTKIFGDGSILIVAQSEQKRSSAVTLSGHTRKPGTHDLKKSKKNFQTLLQMTKFLEITYTRSSASSNAKIKNS